MVPVRLISVRGKTLLAFLLIVILQKSGRIKKRSSLNIQTNACLTTYQRACILSDKPPAADAIRSETCSDDPPFPFNEMGNGRWVDGTTTLPTVSLFINGGAIRNEGLVPCS